MLGKGVATVAHRRWKVCTVYKSIAWHRRTNTFNALPTCPLCFIGDGNKAHLVRRRLVLLRRASKLTTCSAMLAGWLLCWCGGRVFTKICMPPCRCLLSWSGGRTSPRRCSPSWLGWQLHGNGGGVLANVGLATAPLISSTRVLPGAQQGSCRGIAVVPGKDLAGGLVDCLGEDLARIVGF